MSDLDIPVASYRAPRRPESGMRRITLVAGGLAAAFLLALGGYALSGHRQARPVPVIEADSRPIRVKPDNPGGMQVAGQDDDLLSGAADANAGKLGPAPETPQPQALRAQQDAPAAKAPPPAAPSAEAPVAAAPSPAPIRPAAPAPAPPPPSPPPKVAEGGATVQLGALETEVDAATEWDRLSRKMPELLANRRMTVSRADVNGKTWFRIRVGGFPDIAAATAFCGQVRAKGGACNLPT
jgi:hypothetical protein